DRQDEQDVNQAAAHVEREKAQGPENYEYDRQCIQHCHYPGFGVDRIKSKRRTVSDRNRGDPSRTGAAGNAFTFYEYRSAPWTIAAGGESRCGSLAATSRM